MKQIFVFALEPLDARYTKQWYTHVPDQLEQRLRGSDSKVVTISGIQTSKSTTVGAFLDFADTNLWKCSQLTAFIQAMNRGEIPDDAIILFTDFWNPAVINIAYMRDLLGTNWSLHGIAHAGAYDPSDILGYKMRPRWPHNFERSLYYALDYTYFATQFHLDMFLNNLDISDRSKAVLSGQPYQYLIDTLSQYQGRPKTDTVMWPHRYNADKQPEIAEDLSKHFDVFITQKFNLSKQDYYAKLSGSRIVFSCSLHENLGMSMIEGTLVDCIPIAPDRAAYSEIYLPEFLYPSDWTSSLDAYIMHKDSLTAFIKDRIDNYDTYAQLLPEQKQRIMNFISADTMFNHMLGEQK